MSQFKVLESNDVIKKVDTYMQPEDVALVKKALKFATIAHSGQKRQSGEEYIVHPVQVAGILADLKMDAETVSAGFLHDVVEDTGAELSDIQELFGSDIALIVDGVTKLSKIKYKSHREQLAENHRKLLLAMCKDIRVMIVKLADRLHNMRTLNHLNPEKQRRIADETIEIYAPLADRLGIGTIKWELEDLSLRYINPGQYYQIVNSMNSKRKQRVDYINEALAEVKDSLKGMDIQVDEIYGRPKHLYSIYKKMHNKHKKFEEIYDLFAIRVIVESVKDCYAVLGAVHTKWKPMPGRFKDYIAMPKANMYQSLHTTLIGPEGKLLEIQIRTAEMHRVAEYGVAAHWAYKEGIKSEVKSSTDNTKLNWFKKIIELQEDTDDASDFMQSVKGELFGDHVYAFTPNGDVLELPKGAGPLDMAYTIHTDIGNHTTGARVNGKIVPLDYRIKNSDLVEIMTSPASTGPSRDWIKLVSTSKARHKIKQYFRKRDHDKMVESGREMLASGIKEAGFNVNEVLEESNVAKSAKRLDYKTTSDLYAAVGFGDLQVNTIVHRLTSHIRQAQELERQEAEQRGILEEHQTIQNDDKKPKKKTTSIDGVVVEGVSNLLVRLSHCCAPIPGDDIVGYITQGNGISVHRVDCPNVKKAMQTGERLINVHWADELNQREEYITNLSIQGYNRNGLLNDIIKSVNSISKHLTSVQGKIHDEKNVTVSIGVGVKNLNQLNLIIDHIKNISDVYVVKRPFK
ncbi:bifunctional (p)ppGpp synthetase/guanosine-3',5'-bis(diphosphate) 3'-pyrophosphohydrolase [Lactobacillus sp. Sy-1]|uniref:RelA/SpoT family protein n=1 Tax=Lactobacillus sp. Sy-1 TaxID=2109645 RepID=UPI001C5979CD|nr:bifunctional (p)ppGpp synthetase/guanosine-3',5'-bis(diphosphate) 3'-pyrophosphohydrolase [Lactobacillus sp. Sy-1]MBW1605507.1 bifunctional (p)ppGpp synthetase/guanosine-3',5'-bis(diphosphate) 3'-pyrophosphohydrolase [Lactobacillus sp. Sy-1]